MQELHINSELSILREWYGIIDLAVIWSENISSTDLNKQQCGGVKDKTQVNPLDNMSLSSSVLVGDLVELPCFIPQMPLAHPHYPLNRELGKIRRLEESHEDAAEDGDGVPGICRHYLFRKWSKVVSRESVFRQEHTDMEMSFNED